MPVVQLNDLVGEKVGRELPRLGKRAASQRLRCHAPRVLDGARSRNTHRSIRTRNCSGALCQQTDVVVDGITHEPRRLVRCHDLEIDVE